MRNVLLGSMFALLLSGTVYATEPGLSVSQQLDLQLQEWALQDDWNDKDDRKETDKSRSQANHVTGQKKKSMGKAMALSILVPGAGEYYIGNKKKAYYFFAGEALSWIGFASFRIYGNWKEDDMIQYAYERAGAQIEDKDDEFRDMLTFYDNTEQYNTFGRVSDQERPYYHPNDLTHQWHWQSIDDRLAYRELRNQSREAFRRSEFMIGAMVVNRLVSAIFTYNDVRRMNRRIDEFSVTDLSRYHLTIQPYREIRQVELALDVPL